MVIINQLFKTNLIGYLKMLIEQEKCYIFFIEFFLWFLKTGNYIYYFIRKFG